MKVIFVLPFLVVLFLQTASALTSALELTDQDVRELALTEVFPLFTGDDGMECSVEISSLVVTERSSERLKAEIVGARDITQFGCAPVEVRCQIEIRRSSDDRFWQVGYNCD